MSSGSEIQDGHSPRARVEDEHTGESSELAEVRKAYQNISIGGNSRAHLGDQIVHYYGDSRKETLEKLSTLTFFSVHKLICEQRLKGTCTWFLQHKDYLAWRGGSDEHLRKQVLWCPGPPGIGKTFTSAAIIDDLIVYAKDNDAAVLYFYARRERQSEQSVSSFLASLARQLAEACTKASLAGDDTSPRQIGRPSCSTQRKEDALAIIETHFQARESWSTVKLQDLVYELCLLFPRAYLVLDALDEFSTSPEDRARLLTAIQELRVRIGIGNFKICITSRDVESVPKFPNIKRMDMLPPQGDIEDYTRDRIKNSPRHLRWTSADATLQSEVVAVILQRSGRIFKLATLQMDVLCKQLSLLSFKQDMKNLSSEIDAFYDEALARIKENSDHRDVVVKLLCWILHAREPLSMRAMAQALAIEEGMSPQTEVKDMDIDIGTVINMSEGLVQYSDSKQTSLCFAHQTVHTYLQRNAAVLGWNGPELLLRSYATFLSLDACLKTLYERFLEGESLSDAKISESYPLMTSALSDWIWYAEQVDFKITEACIRSLIRAFRNASYLEGYLLEFLCCEFGWTSLLENLLPRSAVPNVTTPRGESLLHTAVSKNNWEAVRLLLRDQNFDINARDILGQSALSLALLRRSIKTIQLLLQCGDVDVNSFDDQGFSPLMVVTSGKSISPYLVIERLLQHSKIKPNLANRDGTAPVHVAAGLGKGSLLSSLLQSSLVDVNASDNLGVTALHMAAFNVDSHILDVLLGHQSINVNARDARGQCALTWVVHNVFWSGKDQSSEWPISRLAGIGVLAYEVCKSWLRFGSTGPQIIALLTAMMKNSMLDINTTDEAGATTLDWAIAYRDLHARLFEIIHGRQRYFASRKISLAHLVTERVPTEHELNDYFSTSSTIANEVINILQSSGAERRGIVSEQAICKQQSVRITLKNNIEYLRACHLVNVTGGGRFTIWSTLLRDYCERDATIDEEFRESSS